MTRDVAESAVERGKRVLSIEARAIDAIANRLDARFAQAVDLLAQCSGKVVVSGMGKSGLIGQKIAATLASTGTPALFLDPAQGLHGDLGMLAKQDVLIAISNSGETEEILKLLPFVKRLNVPVLTLTGKTGSTLAKHSDVTLDVAVEEEACPMGLAPTASTTATMAVGDALAIALLERRGLHEEDFLQFHPGGILGRRLLLRVSDLMHGGDEIPRVQELVPASEAVCEMTSKRMGMTTVVDTTGTLKGIITDGDIRRAFQRGQDLTTARAKDLGRTEPKTIGPDELAARALQTMERFSITSIVVVDGKGEILGIIHLHDLLKNGII